MSKLKKLVLSIITLAFLLTPFLSHRAFAACVVAVEINGTPYQACKGFDELLDKLAEVNIPGFSYDKSTHTISLNGFNGALKGYCGGSCTDGFSETLPTIKITGDSTINNVLFAAGTVATISDSGEIVKSASATNDTTSETTSSETDTSSEISVLEAAEKGLLSDAETKRIKEKLFWEAVNEKLLIIVIVAAGILVIGAIIGIRIGEKLAERSQIPPSSETPFEDNQQ